MNTRNFRLAALVLACLFQLGVVASTLLGAESTLLRGEAFLFETAPVDPIDLFRGRYVSLNFRAQSVRLADVESAAPALGDTLYVDVHEEEGLAEFGLAHRQPPDHDAYLALQVDRVTKRSVRVRLPYDRFYMDENRAPEVDLQMRDRRRKAQAVIRVYRGDGVVEDLRIGEPAP